MPNISLHITAPGHERDGDIVPLEVGGELSLADLKAYVNAETGLDITKQRFFSGGQPLTGGDSTTLEHAGIKDGDLIGVVVQSSNQPRSQQQTRSAAARNTTSGADAAFAAQIEARRQQLLSNSGALAQLRFDAPHIADAVNDSQRFADVVGPMIRAGMEAEAEKERQIAILNDDPFNVEAQEKIEEMIRQEAVMKNLAYAQEHNPEAFGHIVMLYINASVNGHNIKVLVDSGAQMTVMSPSCAEACNISRLIDKRYQGIARGVGTAKILGRVHFADLQINNMILPCSFTVMEGKSVDLLLGLDMLRRYQVSIDLKKNKLVFPGEDVDFLPESEIPKYQDEAHAAEDSVPGPDGTEIGLESGVIKPAGTIPKPGDAAGSSRNFSGAGQTLDSQVQASGSTASSTSSRYPEESIQHLVNLGFGRQEAISALEATDGNVEYAAGLLFGA